MPRTRRGRRALQLACTLLVCGACARASLARADQIVLVSGTVLEGKATRDGGKVVIETDSGEIALPADMVKRIDAGSSGVQEFEAKLARLAPNDVRGLLALADYCRDHDMPAREKEALQRILEVDPDHAEARARLGYVKTPSGWMTRDEQMEARGFVKYEGQWITHDQMLDIERRLLETEAADTARERERARALQAEYDAEAADADQAAWANAQAQPEYPAYPSYGYAATYGYVPFSYQSGHRVGAYGFGYTAGHAREHVFSAPAASRPLPPPPPPARTSAPRPMGAQDAGAARVQHHTRSPR
jgi:hypothetical protein